MKFIFVRHGQTILNAQGKTQGWSDSPLTEVGIQQAYQVKEKLMNIPITKAYCSSSERVIDTTEIILKDRDIELNINRRLKEMNYGRFEATPESIKTEFMKHNSDPYDYREAGGENLEMVIDRISSIFKEIISVSTDNDTILIVGHSGSLYRLMNNYIFKRDDNEIHQEYILNNCDIKVIDYCDGKYVMEEML